MSIHLFQTNMLENRIVHNGFKKIKNDIEA